MRRLIALLILILIPGIYSWGQEETFPTLEPESLVYQALTSQQNLAAAKGVVVVNIWMQGDCPPCKQLRKALSDQSTGPSVLQQWKQQGVKVYQLELVNDGESQPNGLTRTFKIKSAPVLLIFKDGQLETTLKGFNNTDREKKMSSLVEETKRLLQQ